MFENSVLAKGEFAALLLREGEGLVSLEGGLRHEKAAFYGIICWLPVGKIDILAQV